MNENTLNIVDVTYAQTGESTKTNEMGMREMQRRYAAWVLEQVDGIRSHAARRLGIDVKTLGRLLGSPEGGELEPKE